MKLTEIMQKQKTLSGASHGESKETVLTEKTVQMDDNQAGDFWELANNEFTLTENQTQTLQMSRICLMCRLCSSSINLPLNVTKNCSFLTSGTDRMKILFQVFTNCSLSG